MRSITPQQLYHRSLLDEKLHILDIRSPTERATIHIAGVQSLSFEQLNTYSIANLISFPKMKPIYIFCHSENRARKAVAALEMSGYAKCYIIKGEWDWF